MKRIPELYPKPFQLLGITLFIFFLAGCDSVRTMATPLPSGVGRIAFYAHGIYIINSDSTGLKQIAEPGANKPAWSPDGQRIAFVGRDLEIYVMNADGSEQTRLTNLGNNIVPSPIWSPDGEQMVFTSYRGDGVGAIYLINIEEALQGKTGSDPKRLNHFGVDAQNISWSPDGRWIAFSYRDNDDAPSEIGMINVANALQRTDGDEWALTSEGSFPVWAPDGKQIAFVSYRDGNEEIYVMNADGNNQRRLTTNSDIDATPAWSSNGQQITFVRYHNIDLDGNYEIYVMGADGSNQIPLSKNLAADSFPAWSPDGQQIAFVSKRDGNQEIYVMDADGSNQTRLTNTPEDEWGPVWLPR